MNDLYRGGITFGLNYIAAKNITWPFVKLNISKDWLTFIYSGQEHKISRFEIERISLYKGIFSKGIRLHFKDKSSYPYFIFWSFNIKELASCLSIFGYNIN
jgi:hypothetical protein